MKRENICPMFLSPKLYHLSQRLLGHVSISYRGYFYNERETEDGDQSEDD